MGDKHEVSRFGHVELADMPEDLRERIGAVAERSGFVPNVFRALARRPRELRAFLDYHDALMESNDGLSKAERELVVVATSGANSCTYCVVAHGATVRALSGNPALGDTLSVNYRAADLSPRHRAMLDFAAALTLEPARCDTADTRRLREAGFSDRAIWDITAVAAFFNMTNRVATATKMKPNAEYYSMARDAAD